jgi:hypothetical protein
LASSAGSGKPALAETEHRRVTVDKPPDADGKRRFDMSCLCGWRPTTDDGWDALDEWYIHVGIL